jgi:hypothetical protein
LPVGTAAGSAQRDLVNGCWQLYRLVALAVCVYCARKAWLGYVEGKILFVSDDWRDWSRRSRQVFYRDAMPIRYWMQLGGTAFGAALCLVGAIVGWQSSG